MRIAMFEGYHGGLAQVAAPVLGYGYSRSYGALTSDQLSMADAAVAAVVRGRSAWEVWKPSIEEVRAMRGWLDDERVGLATFDLFIQKARDAMGTAEWEAFIARYAPTINAARAAYETATDRPIIPEPIVAGISSIATAGKWLVIGLVAYAVIQGLSKVPSARR